MMTKYIHLLFIALNVLFASCFSDKAQNESTAIVQLSGNNKATCVSLTSDEDGYPVSTWCETDSSGQKSFFMAYFNRQNNLFTEAIAIPVEANTNFHAEGMPKIAIKKNGTIIAVYETSDPTEENRFAGFIKYIQSSDKGKSWTAPTFLHKDSTAGKGHSFASITRLADGEIGACWLDVATGAKGGGRPVMFAKTNGSNGFTGEKIIDSVACQCCRTAISCDQKGNISIMFRDIIEDSIRDMSVITSSNNGNTFSKAFAFTNDGWVINGCPHNGPSVINHKGQTYATWFTGGERSGVYYAQLRNDGSLEERKMISNNARHIQLCVLSDGTKMMAYNETIKKADSFYTKIAVNKIMDGIMKTADITNDDVKASYPVIHPAGSKNVVVAWTENDKIYTRIIEAEQINKAPVQNAISLLLPEKPRNRVKLSVYKDPVCGMPVKDGVADTTLHKGKIYGFCNKSCRDRYIASIKR